jgi:DNA-binding CsgD family transcriptional regulator
MNGALAGGALHRENSPFCRHRFVWENWLQRWPSRRTTRSASLWNRSAVVPAGDLDLRCGRPRKRCTATGSKGTHGNEIADRLFISPKTADHHIQHIYDKIGVSTRAAAALWATQHAVV